MHMGSTQWETRGGQGVGGGEGWPVGLGSPTPDFSNASWVQTPLRIVRWSSQWIFAEHLLYNRLSVFVISTCKATSSAHIILVFCPSWDELGWDGGRKQKTNKIIWDQQDNNWFGKYLSEKKFLWGWDKWIPRRKAFQEEETARAKTLKGEFLSYILKTPKRSVWLEPEVYRGAQEEVRGQAT